MPAPPHVHEIIDLLTLPIRKQIDALDVRISTLEAGHDDISSDIRIHLDHLDRLAARIRQIEGSRSTADVDKRISELEAALERADRRIATLDAALDVAANERRRIHARLDAR